MSILISINKIVDKTIIKLKCLYEDYNPEFVNIFDKNWLKIV